MNPWPDASQTLLLTAALAEPEPARVAWQEWCALHWPAAASDAASYALMGLLYTRLPLLGETRPELAARLREVHRHQLLRNQMSLMGLRQTLELFSAAGIPVLLFKGLPLLQLAYGDWGARLTSDLDLLVPDAQVEAADAQLLANGWHNPQRPDAYYRAVNHAASYTRSGYPSIDLHWRPFMMDSSPAAEAALWQCARPMQLGTVNVQVPALEDLFLLVCLHGRKPMPSAVTRWVADAAGLLRRMGVVDWQALQRRAIATGLEAPLREAQGYLHDVFALAPAPASRAVPSSPLAGRLIWHCCQQLTRLTPATPEVGLARSLGLAMRLPYTLGYNILRFWLPRRQRGEATTPLQLLTHLLKAHNSHAQWRGRQASALTTGGRTA